MERHFILASSKRHRWAHWWAPEGRPPMPGCRRIQTSTHPRPSQDASAYRWWLRSSQTNLQKEGWQGAGNNAACEHLQLLYHVSLHCCALCLLSRADPCLAAEADRSALHITSQSLMLSEPPSGLCQPSQLSAHYPLSDMGWSVCQTSTLMDLPDILTHPAGFFSLSHSCLVEWAPGCLALHWYAIKKGWGGNWHFANRAAKRQHNKVVVELLCPKGMEYKRQVVHENH